MSRRLRADARQNRERILEVAEAVFAAKGPTASTEEVARQAGVGIGTVFRHFPTKEALLEAVFIARLRQLADEALRLAGSEDPGRAFFGFFTLIVDQAATKKAYVDALTDAGVDVHSVAAQAGNDFRRSFGDLLAGAQDAGAVRRDVDVTELIALLVGASRAVEHVGEAPHLRSRITTLVLDALRP